MSSCKASEIPRNEAYIEVRRRWAFYDSLYCTFTHTKSVRPNPSRIGDVTSDLNFTLFKAKIKLKTPFDVTSKVDYTLFPDRLASSTLPRGTAHVSDSCGTSGV